VLHESTHESLKLNIRSEVFTIRTARQKSYLLKKGLVEMSNKLIE